MRQVEDFVDKLKEEYGGLPSFKRLCEEHRITPVKADIEDGLRGLLVACDSFALIVLNAKISYEERRDHSWHELWHFFHSPRQLLRCGHYGRLEERKADLFAALCRIPCVRPGDNIDTITDRYNVSPWLAKIRIEHELKKLNRS